MADTELVVKITVSEQGAQYFGEVEKRSKKELKDEVDKVDEQVKKPGPARRNASRSWMTKSRNWKKTTRPIPKSTSA